MPSAYDVGLSPLSSLAASFEGRYEQYTSLSITIHPWTMQTYFTDVGSILTPRLPAASFPEKKTQTQELVRQTTNLSPEYLQDIVNKTLRDR